MIFVRGRVVMGSKVLQDTLYVTFIILLGNFHKIDKEKNTSLSITAKLWHF